MSLTKRTLETLVDLVEIKLSCIQVTDNEDAREFATLRNCLQELELIGRGGESGATEGMAKRRGRRPKSMSESYMMHA